MLNMGLVVGTNTSSTSTVVYKVETVNAGDTDVFVHAYKNPSLRSSKAAPKIKSAVFSYIQARRAMGDTKINTSQIAKALCISVSAVDQTIASLKTKGVKPEKK
jgi:hypothetical protein